jgi:leader peptidase (prepilin peptidase)/N-methyltransferase
MHHLQTIEVTILASLLGLLMGSFLNVVIYRLPLMIERAQQHYSYMVLRMLPNLPESKFINLLNPRSSCMHCHHKLRLIDNIPIISYLLLRGRCHFCQHKISWQYPLVELLSCILCGICGYKFGASYKMFFSCIFTLGLIAAAMIDLKHMILPDEINLTGIWLGLILSIYGIFTNSNDAIIGAVTGYFFLWSIFWIFYIITKRNGLGGGDLKLFALFGAWFGWQSLQFIMTLAALGGSLVGIILIKMKKHDFKKPMPFGPFLALSAYIYLIY